MKTTKTILITGATAGIGRAAALHLARCGHHVIATGRRHTALASLEREASEAGLRLDTLRLDVTDATSIDEAKRATDRLTGDRGIEVIINNAGYGLAAPLAEVKLDDLRHQFDTNVFGLVAVTRAFLGDMMDRRAGRVINVSSIGGRTTFPLMGPYHASKYAVEALSDALRMEVAPFGIAVSVIEPGPIATEFADRLNDVANPYKRTDSRYASVLERADTIEGRMMAMAVGPEVIARAIERAATARRPRPRYVAPFSSQVALAVLRALPTRVVDGISRLLFGLTRSQLDAPAPRALETGR